MKKVPRISEAEWEVMKVVWEQPNCSASQIISILNERDRLWTVRTVKAFLNRLIKKKALGFKLDGRSYLYYPLVRQSDCTEAASSSFLNRVFGGSLTPMLAHFVSRKKLSRDEIAELKKLLEDQ